MLIARLCLVVASAVLLLAQAPPPKRVEQDEVVATMDGEKLTPARIEELRESLPPQFRQAAGRMDNKQFLKSYAELLALSKLAEKEKTAELEPYKSQLAFLRMNFLAQTYVDHLSRQIHPSQEDLLKYYNEHKSEYEEASVRGIYVAFSPSTAKPEASSANAKKSVTEEQARAKAEGLRAQLKKGADFAKLAKENSDDASTADKGGDLGPLKRSSTSLPADVKNAIFGLKPGDISGPVRQPAGFYIFQLEKIRTLPFEEVSVNIAPMIQGIKMKEELDRIRNSIKITYDNESFFSHTERPAPPPNPLRP